MHLPPRVVMPMRSLPARRLLEQSLERSRCHLNQENGKVEGLKSWVNPRSGRRAGWRQKAGLRLLLFPFLDAWALGDPSRRPSGVPAAGRRPHVQAQLSAAGLGRRSAVRGAGAGGGDWGPQPGLGGGPGPGPGVGAWGPG